MAADTLAFPLSATAGGAPSKTFNLALHKLDATAAPGVGNDDSQGYVGGSVWADRTNHKVYVCTDNTTGAATWEQVLAGSGTGADRHAASAGSTSLTFLSEQYLSDSAIKIPPGGVQQYTTYRCRFRVSKTAAGTAAPTVTLRIGAGASTSDTAHNTLTFSAQTAAVDDGLFDVWAHFETVGSGTSAKTRCVAELRHRLTTTGLGSAGACETQQSQSTGFDSTAIGADFIGLSVNGGASASWTVDSVQADLINLP
jgi:hypothetical protein